MFPKGPQAAGLPPPPPEGVAPPGKFGSAQATSVADERRDLSRRLRKLERLFDVSGLRAERLGAASVAAYYGECHAAYRKHHSSEGATHMAINGDGRFHPDGFREQLRRVEALWAGHGAPQRVLELGFGQGYNLAYLAPRHPGVRFDAIDLTPEHFAIASQRLQGVPNVHLALGDLHELALPDAGIDTAIAVEVFCYAHDVPRALAEAHRVLKPGGRFVLFDGYQIARDDELQGDDRLAVDLVARGMALERWQQVDMLAAQARGAGFEVEQFVSLDREVLPNLRRLDRLVGSMIRIEWLARRALSRRAAARSRNVLSGYLMHRTVTLGILGYRQWVLRKAG